MYRNGDFSSGISRKNADKPYRGEVDKDSNPLEPTKKTVVDDDSGLHELNPEFLVRAAMLNVAPAVQRQGYSRRSQKDTFRNGRLVLRDKIANLRET
jgi:hypothetical protein